MLLVVVGVWYIFPNHCENLWLQYMNSTICIVRFGPGLNGGVVVGIGPSMHTMLKHNLAEHL